MEKVEVLAAIVLISAIGAVYEAAYSEKIYNLYCRCICNNDYRLLDMTPLAKGILCFAYMLHMALCGAAVWLARHARGILAICNILVVCGYPANAVAKIYLQYGTKQHDIRDI